MSFEGARENESIGNPSSRSARPRRAKRSPVPYGLAGLAATIVAVAGIMLGTLGGSAAASNPAGSAVAPAFDRQSSSSRDAQRTDIQKQLEQRDATLTAVQRDVNSTVAKDQAADRAAILSTTQKGIVSEEKRLKEELNKLAFPAQGKLGSPWGMRLHPILGYYRMHWGVDIGAACGSPLKAVYDGVVTHAAYDGGAGNNVKIQHSTFRGKSLQTTSMHMQQMYVRVGQKVKKGDVIGTVGNTGLSTECHLHFETFVNGQNVDPAPLLRG